MASAGRVANRVTARARTLVLPANRIGSSPTGGSSPVQFVPAIPAVPPGRHPDPDASPRAARSFVDTAYYSGTRVAATRITREGNHYPERANSDGFYGKSLRALPPMIFSRASGGRGIAATPSRISRSEGT